MVILFWKKGRTLDSSFVFLICILKCFLKHMLKPYVYFYKSVCVRAHVCSCVLACTHAHAHTLNFSSPNVIYVKSIPIVIFLLAFLLFILCKKEA